MSTELFQAILFRIINLQEQLPNLNLTNSKKFIPLNYNNFYLNYQII